ncbi:MAG: glycosyl hydrolase, partial [Bacteroidota bacterium]
SDDSGKKWTKTHDGFMDDIYYSYGYYFGQIRVNPINPRKVYIMGVPVLRSNDGGATFESINEDNVHVDHHALWVNPDQKGHLILGNDGGVNISYDEGDTWVKCNTPAVGQFYTVAVDMDEPYNVYGGLQDNGVWTGPSTYEASYGWHNSGQYPYKSIMGGDGMQIAIDSRDNNTVYTGYQFGNYFRINKQTGDSEYITPKHELGDRPYRWNWQTPIHLSKHNQDILYMGSNHFHRSFDQGKTFETLSKKDLTKGGKKGDVAFGTLTTISESPKRFGLLYVGTDDGFVHLSKDGGYSWERISDQLPQDMWVTRVQASAHEEGRVLVALNGYRYDHFNVYLYISDNFGKTWIKVGNGLPAEPVNVFKEDPVNPDLLYVGTDHGLYISLDRGKTFMQMNGGLAGASVHDLVVHPRDQELVIGTHGRSIYKTDIQYVQALVDSITSQAFYAWDLESIRHRNWGNAWSQWFPAEDPEVTMPMFTQSPGNVSVTLKMGSLEVHRFSTSVDAGLNFPIYNLAISESQAKILEKEVNKEKEEKDQIKIKAADNGKYYLAKGDYEVILELNGKKVTKTLKLE